MSLLLAVTIAAAAVQPTCSWDRPGHNPYTGSTAAAIDRYTDIPEAVRSTLKRRIEEHQPDDEVAITRDAIGGKRQYNAAIRDMHFGSASVCGNVTRGKWAAGRSEPGAVYCVDQHCILVPQICGNISRISRQPTVTAQTATPDVALLGDEEVLPEFTSTKLVNASEHIPDQPLTEAEQQEMLRLAGFVPGERPEIIGGLGINGDDVVTSPVPEPETWAMLLSGLGLIGWAGRRRARAAKANQAGQHGDIAG